MGNAAFLEISAIDPLNFGPIIYGIVALAALIGAIVGFWRGAARQAVKVAAVLVSVVFAYATSVLVFNRIWDYLSVKSVEEVESLISKLGIKTDWMQLSYFYELDPSVSSLVFAVPLALVVLPVLFIPFYLVANGILHLFYRLICYLCGFKSDRNTVKTRTGGALIGVIEALVFVGIMFTPIVGLSDVALEAKETINERAPDDGLTYKLNDKYAAYAESVCENKVIRIYEKIGVGALYERIATLEIDGEMKNMTNLTPDVARLVSDSAAFKGTNPKRLTDEDGARIKSMIEIFENNPYLSKILAGTVSAAAYAYDDGTFPVSAPEPYETLILSSLSIFKTSSSENITDDLNTLSEAYLILSRSGALSAFDDGSEEMLRAMTKTDSEGARTSDKVIQTLRSNERTAPLVTFITKLSLTLMNEEAGLLPDADGIYESVKEKINSNLITVNKSDFESEEEYTEKISEELDSMLTENGIEIEKEIVDGMAEYFTDNFSDASEITDEMASDVILSYYDAYLKHKEQE